MIQIDKEPFATDYWYSGTYTKDEHDYDFTIHSSENCKTLTWIDEIPENEEFVEKEIMKQFNQI